MVAEPAGRQGETDASCFLRAWRAEVHAGKDFAVRKTLMAPVLAIAMALSAATAAFAVSATIGNDATLRTHVDSYRNFAIVDTNNPAPFDGVFSQVDYYAHRAGDVRFVLVDTAGTVTWVSEVITATAAGTQTATLTTPAGVTAGSNLGVYSVNYGVVSYAYGGDSDAFWEPNNAGLPAVGDAFNTAGAQARTYSMNAKVTATSPEICKDGGWEAYGYKNQGQCIASVVANDHAGKA